MDTWMKKSEALNYTELCEQKIIKHVISEYESEITCLIIFNYLVLKNCK